MRPCPFFLPAPTRYICFMRSTALIVLLILSNVCVFGAPIINDQAFITQYQGALNGISIPHPPNGLVKEKTLLLDFHKAWWQILNNQQVSENTTWIYNQVDALERYTPIPEKCNDLELFLYASAALFAIRAAALNGNKFAGAKRYFKAVPYLKMVLKRADQADELLLIAAMYNYGMPKFLQQNKMAAPFFWSFPAADAVQGQKWLLQCAQSTSVFVRTEAQYFLFKFNNNLFNKPEKANLYLKTLLLQYPDNKVLKAELQQLQKLAPNKV